MIKYLLQLTLTLSILSQFYCEPQSDRIFLIDQFQQNLLFRGNDPTQDGQFQLQKLTQIMKQKSQEQGVQFPEQFELVVISVLKDSPINTVIQDYFLENPQQGEFINYPQEKEVYQFPGNYKQSLRKYLASRYQSWTKDHLGELGYNIRQKLINNDTTKSKTRVVYLHCRSGINVVHMGFGGYELFVHQWTNQQVLNWYSDRNLPAPSEAWQTGVSWYCLFKQGNDFSQDLNCLYSLDI